MDNQKLHKNTQQALNSSRRIKTQQPSEITVVTQVENHNSLDGCATEKMIQEAITISKKNSEVFVDDETITSLNRTKSADGLDSPIRETEQKSKNTVNIQQAAGQQLALAASQKSIKIQRLQSPILQKKEPAGDSCQIQKKASRKSLRGGNNVKSLKTKKRGKQDMAYYGVADNSICIDQNGSVDLNRSPQVTNRPSLKTSQRTSLQIQPEKIYPSNFNTAGDSESNNNNKGSAIQTGTLTMGYGIDQQSKSLRKPFSTLENMQKMVLQSTDTVKTTNPQLITVSVQEEFGANMFQTEANNENHKISYQKPISRQDRLTQSVSKANISSLKLKNKATRQLQMLQDETSSNKASQDVSRNKGSNSQYEKKLSQRTDQVFQSHMNEVQILKTQMQALNKLEHMNQEKKKKSHRKSSRLLPTVHPTSITDNVLFFPVDRKAASKGPHPHRETQQNSSIENSFAFELNNVPIHGSVSFKSDDTSKERQTADVSISPEKCPIQAIYKTDLIKESIKHLKSIKKPTDDQGFNKKKQINCDDDRMQLRPNQFKAEPIMKKEKKSAFSLGSNQYRNIAATQGSLPKAAQRTIDAFAGKPMKTKGDPSKALGSLLTKQTTLMRQVNSKGSKKLDRVGSSMTQSKLSNNFNINQKVSEDYQLVQPDQANEMNYQTGLKSRQAAELSSHNGTARTLLGVVSEQIRPKQSQTVQTKQINRKGSKSLSKQAQLEQKSNINNRKEQTQSTQSMLPAIKKDLNLSAKASPLIVENKLAKQFPITQSCSQVKETNFQNSMNISPMLAKIKSNQINKLIKQSKVQKFSTRNRTKGSMVSQSQAPLIQTAEIAKSFMSQSSADEATNHQTIDHQNNKLQKTAESKSKLLQSHFSSVQDLRSSYNLQCKKEFKNTLIGLVNNNKQITTSTQEETSNLQNEQKLTESAKRRKHLLMVKASKHRRISSVENVSEIFKRKPENNFIPGMTVNDQNQVVSADSIDDHVDDDRLPIPIAAIRQSMSRTQERFKQKMPLSKLEPDQKESQRKERVKTPTSPPKPIQDTCLQNSAKMLEFASQGLSQPSLPLDENNFSHKLVRLITGPSGFSLTKSQEDHSTNSYAQVNQNSSSLDRNQQQTISGDSNEQDKVTKTSTRNLKNLANKNSSRESQYGKRIEQMRQVYCSPSPIIATQIQIQGEYKSASPLKKQSTALSGSPNKKAGSPQKTRNQPPFRNSITQKSDSIELNHMRTQQSLIQHIRQTTRDQLQKLALQHTNELKKFNEDSPDCKFPTNPQSAIIDALFAQLANNQQNYQQPAAEDVFINQGQDCNISPSRPNIQGASNILDPRNIMKAINGVTKQQIDTQIFNNEKSRRERMNRIYVDQQPKSPKLSLNRGQKYQQQKETLQKQIASGETLKSAEKSLEENWVLLQNQSHFTSNPQLLQCSEQESEENRTEEISREVDQTDENQFVEFQQQQTQRSDQINERVIKTDVPTSKEKFVKLKTQKVLFKDSSVNKIYRNASFKRKFLQDNKSPNLARRSLHGTPKGSVAMSPARVSLVDSQAAPVSKVLMATEKMDQERRQRNILVAANDRSCRSNSRIAIANVKSSVSSQQQDLGQVHPTSIAKSPISSKQVLAPVHSIVKVKSSVGGSRKEIAPVYPISNARSPVQGLRQELGQVHPIQNARSPLQSSRQGKGQVIPISKIRSPVQGSRQEVAPVYPIQSARSPVGNQKQQQGPVQAVSKAKSPVGESRQETGPVYAVSNTRSPVESTRQETGLVQRDAQLNLGAEAVTDNQFATMPLSVVSSNGRNYQLHESQRTSKRGSIQPPISSCGADGIAASNKSSSHQHMTFYNTNVYIQSSAEKLPQNQQHMSRQQLQSQQEVQQKPQSSCSIAQVVMQQQHPQSIIANNDPTSLVSGQKGQIQLNLGQLTQMAAPQYVPQPQLEQPMNSPWTKLQKSPQHMVAAQQEPQAAQTMNSPWNQQQKSPEIQSQPAQDQFVQNPAQQQQQSQIQPQTTKTTLGPSQPAQQNIQHLVKQSQQPQQIQPQPTSNSKQSFPKQQQQQTQIQPKLAQNLVQSPQTPQQQPLIQPMLAQNVIQSPQTPQQQQQMEPQLAQAIMQSPITPQQQPLIQQKTTENIMQSTFTKQQQPQIQQMPAQTSLSPQIQQQQLQMQPQPTKSMKSPQTQPQQSEIQPQAEKSIIQSPSSQVQQLQQQSHMKEQPVQTMQSPLALSQHAEVQAQPAQSRSISSQQQVLQSPPAQQMDTKQQQLENNDDDDFDEDQDDSPRNFVRVYEVEAYHEGMDLMTGRSSCYQEIMSPQNYQDHLHRRSRAGSKTGGSTTNKGLTSKSGKSTSLKPGFKRKRNKQPSSLADAKSLYKSVRLQQQQQQH